MKIPENVIKKTHDMEAHELIYAEGGHCMLN